MWKAACQTLGRRVYRTAATPRPRLARLPLRLRHQRAPSTSVVPGAAASCSAQTAHYQTLADAMPSTSDAPASATAQTTFQRLPTDVVPSHYALQLKPCLKTFKLNGTETVDVKVVNEISFIRLNVGGGLKIGKASFTNKGSKKVLKDLAVTYDEKWETATMTLPEKVSPCEGQLDIEFTSEIRDDLHGFYRSTYKDAKTGEEKYMASTQFESTFARRAFPCWDEPLFKAVFDIELVAPKNKVALANTNIVKTEDLPDGMQRVKYAPSPKMSTYLVAFALGDFEYVEDKTPEGVTVRIYTVEGKKEKGRFSLEVATKAISYFGKYFNSPYPLPKSDLIAVPDFSMGAMENWGLVTFREILLLYDAAVSSARIKERIALVVCHELAHMWFGDLVTMKWWTDLWLKEGFATFMEYLCTHVHYPEMNIWTTFICDETLAALQLDALKNSHPIEVPINDPSEVDQIYDSISYAKASSIIRMLHAYLGEEKFQKGLQSYVAKYAYSNAVTRDLWEELSKTSGEDVAALMSMWTAKMGFPVVEVKSSQVGNDKRKLVLRQRRFLADGSSEDPANKTIWQVPITISTSKAPEKVAHRIILKKEEEEFMLDNIGPEDWFKLNAGFSGYYRVDYESADLARLLPALEKMLLPTTDRFNLVSDIFAMVVAGHSPVSQFLDVFSKSAGETEMNVWADIDAAVSTLNNVLEHAPETQARFNALVCKVYEPLASKLTFDPIPGKETHASSQLRPILLNRLGRSGHKPTIDEALKRFDAFVTGKDLNISPDMRGKIFGLAVQNRGEAAFKQLTELYRKNDTPSEVQLNCLTALGQSKDPKLAEQCLSFTFGKDSSVRLQDIVYPPFGMAVTKEGQEKLWHFVHDNYEEVCARLFDNKPTHTLLIRLVEVASNRHCSEQRADEIQKRFEKLQLSHPGLVRPVQQSIEKVKLNAKLLKSAPQIGEWLTANGF